MHLVVHLYFTNRRAGVRPNHAWRAAIAFAQVRQA